MHFNTQDKKLHHLLSLTSTTTAARGLTLLMQYSVNMRNDFLMVIVPL